MMAEDLGRQIALDALGTLIPRGDVAWRVEHEYGVVGDRADDRLEPEFGEAVQEIACIGGAEWRMRVGNGVVLCPRNG
ncbi:hypothetical protein BvRS1_44700 [Burkholderia vietnamiensis]|nr:hypothetical protein BvRS1_44700 [Burkholderia vietnamiensis]